MQVKKISDKKNMLGTSTLQNGAPTSYKWSYGPSINDLIYV